MEAKERKIQEIQILEQNIQNIMLQKQAFQMELSETKNAKMEIEKSNGEVFKIVGQLMIKSNVSSVKEEMNTKEKLLSLRVASLEKQELSLSEKIDSLKKEVLA